MNIKLVEFQITGLSPLLTHNPAGMGANAGGMKAKKIPKPEDEAKAGLYMNAKGEYGIPMIGFRNGLLSAVGGKKVGRQPARMIISASVFIDDAHEMFIIRDAATGKPAKSYEIDARRAVVQRNGVIRHRPKFANWTGTARLLIDHDLIDPAVVEQNLNEAGTMAGVGDYRVNKGGWFGRYTAKLI